MLQKKTALTATAEMQSANLKDVHGPDARIRITFREREWDFAAEIKKTITRANLGEAIHELRPFGGSGVLVTTYITPQLAEQLKEMNMAFMDTAGNAYICDPPLYVFVKGEKPGDDYRRDHKTRAFQPGGLQVVFALLCRPGLEDAPYREIARQAAVALGTVTWAMLDLKEKGYLMDMGKRGRRLIRKQKLLARWVATYPDRLRAKKRLGTYTAADIDWWKRADLVNFGALWGGESAAAKLTEYLKPQVVTIYAREKPGKWMLIHKLRKDPNGNIEVLNAFWNFAGEWPGPADAHRDLVHPILIYADLLATGDARNIETAEIIYAEHIARFIQED
jgi:hypothetical protein